MKNKELKIVDVWLASFLRFKGVKLIRTEAEITGRTVIFVFEYPDNLSELTNDFERNYEGFVRTYKETLGIIRRKEGVRNEG